MIKCPECWNQMEPTQKMCDDCSQQIDDEEERLDREHEANETCQYRNQLV